MHIYAIGTMPNWAQTLIEDYQTRLPNKGFWSLAISSLRTKTQAKHNSLTQRHADTVLLMNSVSQDAYSILLDEQGKKFTSLQLTDKLSNYQKNTAFIIGAAAGVDHNLCKADECWSLSDLTLTHVFARLLLVEQLYRAHSIHTNHPYHKGCL